MAKRYWVGGSGSWNGSNTTNWSDSSGGSGGFSIPTSADEVIFDGNSGVGTVTLTLGSACRSLDAINYLGTFQHNAVTLSIGDGTPGDGNVALRFGSGMTYNPTSTASEIALVSTSSTEQSIQTSGKTLSRLVLNAVGGVYKMFDAMTITNNFVHTAGSLETNNYNLTCSIFSSSNSNVRTLKLGTSVITITNTTGTNVVDIATVTNLTFEGENATFVIGTASTAGRTFRLTSQIIGTFRYTVNSTGAITIVGSPTFLNLDFNDSVNPRQLTISNNTMLTVGNMNNLYGASGRLMTIKSATNGTLAYLRVVGGYSAPNWLNIQDIYVATPNKFFAGANSTDSGNNTNITFTAPPAVDKPYLYQDVESNQNQTNTVRLPYVAPVGSLIVLQYASVSNPGTLTLPSGFTLLAQEDAGSLAANNAIYYKVADGTERDFTVTSTNSQVSSLKVLNIHGFDGTPTLDVFSENNSAASSVTSLLSNAGSPPSNTDNPAYALVFVAANSSLGASVSADNSFTMIRIASELSNSRVAVKQLTSNASVESTYTWTTARRASAILAVFKDVISSGQNSGFFSVL